MTRSQSLLIATAFAICLIAGSQPRIVGDGGEYVAQALNFASWNAPPLRPNAIPAIEARIAEFEPTLAEWQIENASVRAADRGHDFLHFWFYALLATPALWVTEKIGAAPTMAFAAVNIALFIAALAVALPRIGAAASVLLFGGPIIWWLDKAHTEVFTFAMLAIAFALLRERPGWSLVAAGAASTQNPPIAALVPLLLVAALARDRHAYADRRLLAGLAGGIGLAALHPVYTYVRHGTPSLLLHATRAELPRPSEIGAVVLDPTIGLIGNYPLFLVVVAAAVGLLARREPRSLRSPEIVSAAVAACVFLFSFARTGNFHHGGTPSLSRYALWLVPLAIPILAAFARSGRLFWATAVGSALISVFAFHPAVPQYGREPTWLATLLWTKLPAWHNPLPEIFIETQIRREEPWLPVSTAGCEKVLMMGRGNADGLWPMPCYPSSLPASCRERGGMCYANRTSDGYEFAQVATPAAAMFFYRRDAVWPAAAEPHVRRLYDAWGWRHLRWADEVTVLRQVIGARALTFGRDDRFMIVLRDIEEDARVLLRMPRGMIGILMDPLTGRTLSMPRYDGPPGEMWDIPLPAEFDLLLLALRAERVAVD